MSDTPITNKPKINRWIAISGFVLLLIACIFLYFRARAELDPSSLETDRPPEDYQLYQPALTDIPVTDVVTLEGNADMKFPASAYEVYAYVVTNFRRIDTDIRFSMKASELPTFVKTTLCNKPFENIIPTAEQKKPNTYLAWWTPYQATTLQRCTGDSKSAHQTIFFDMTNPEIYIIYVHNRMP